MATLAQIRTKADAALVYFWNALAIRQEAYFTKRGKYFQVLVTSAVIDGQDTSITSTSPSDEHYLSDVNFSYATQVPFQIQVDEWGNATEKGFKATCIIETNSGARYTRSRSLTDTRILKQDYDYTDPDNPAPIGEPYPFGADPVIVTSAWEQIIPFS